MMTHRPKDNVSPGTAFFFGVLFLILGLLMLAGALYYGFQVETFVAGAQRVTGTVTSLTQKGNDFFPVISFETESGQPVVYNDSQGSNPPSYKVNQSVELLYPTGHPELARVNSVIGLWFTPIVFGVGSLFFLLSSIGAIANAIRRW